MEQHRTSILIVCIGNDLVADDAIGFHIYQRLSTRPLPDEMKLLYLSVGGISLLEHLDGSEKGIIVVDAVRFGSAPGTVTMSCWDSLPVPTHSPVSIHGIGLREVFEILPVLYPGQYTSSIYCIGIEGEEFHQCGVGLSPSVHNAIDQAITIIDETFDRIQKEILA